MTDWRRIFSLREAGVYYALLLLLGVLAALAAARGLPLYLSGQNLGNIAYQASLVGIMGVAMTVMLITGAFDLSVASVAALAAAVLVGLARSEEHTSELQSLMRISYAVFCFNKIHHYHLLCI